MIGRRSKAIEVLCGIDLIRGISFKSIPVKPFGLIGFKSSGKTLGGSWTALDCYPKKTASCLQYVARNPHGNNTFNPCFEFGLAYRLKQVRVRPGSGRVLSSVFVDWYSVIYPISPCDKRRTLIRGGAGIVRGLPGDNLSKLRDYLGHNGYSIV